MMDADDERGRKVVKTRGKFLELEKVELIGINTDNTANMAGKCVVLSGRTQLYYLGLGLNSSNFLYLGDL